MAREKCREFEGHSTTHYSSFVKVFEITGRALGSMIEAGEGKCIFCGQKIVYAFDETLIPKLRIEFIDT